MSTNLRQTPWEDALNITRHAHGIYHADFPVDFCIGNRAHGGLMTCLVGKALQQHFTRPTQNLHLPDLLEIKVHYLRPATHTKTTITIEELAVSKRNATALVRVAQGGKMTSVFLANVGDPTTLTGPTLNTHHHLDPPPPPPNFPAMDRHADPNWISYTVPWRPKSPVSVWTHVRSFFPAKPYANPSITDAWICPVDADPSSNFRFQTVHLPFIADLTLSPLENLQGDDASGSNTSLMQLAEKHRVERESGNCEPH